MLSGQPWRWPGCNERKRAKESARKRVQHNSGAKPAALQITYRLVSGRALKAGSHAGMFRVRKQAVERNRFAAPGAMEFARPAPGRASLSGGEPGGFVSVVSAWRLCRPRSRPVGTGYRQVSEQVGAHAFWPARGRELAWRRARCGHSSRCVGRYDLDAPELSFLARRTAMLRFFAW